MVCPKASKKADEMRDRQSQFAATLPNQQGEAGRQPQVLARAPSPVSPSGPRGLAGARPARVAWGPCPPFPQSGFFLWRRARWRGLGCPNHGVDRGCKTVDLTTPTPSIPYHALSGRHIYPSNRNYSRHGQPRLGHRRQFGTLTKEASGADQPSPLPLPELATFHPVSFTFGHLRALVSLLYGRTKGPGATGG